MKMKARHQHHAHDSSHHIEHDKGMNNSCHGNQGHDNHGTEDSHDKHAGHSVGMFKDKFWLSFWLTVPVLVYSEMIQQWFKFTPPIFPGSQYIPFVFSTIIFFYGGMVFIKSAWSELRAKAPGMMTLISLAIITAYLYSILVQFWGSGEGFFWELATLITIMLLGHWLEMASVAKAENALESIAKLLPDKADKLVNGKPKLILVSELKVGDLVLVRPGGSIPADGIVVEGTSSVNESAITGESKPISKTINDEVIAGTINQDGSLTVKILKLGDDSTLAGIIRLVSEAQKSKSNTQVLADKAAFGLTIVAIISGLLTFIYWLIAKDAAFALERAVTVLIIACPHALGLAIPLVVSISTSRSAQNGLLVRKRLALESARKLDWVLFDKTGTLTKGEHGVTDIWASDRYSNTEVLKIMASLEQKSEHIIGKGIVAEVAKQQVLLEKVSCFQALPGLGVKAKLPRQGEFMAVSRAYLQENNLAIPRSFIKQISRAAKVGKTEVYLIKGSKTVVGAIALADVLRKQSQQTIAELKHIGIRTAMVTGDSQEVADYVAKQLGIDQVYANVRPDNKASKVRELQAKGNKVAFVGDGINDAPALTLADIGLAIGAGTDVAIKSADIILIKNDPTDVLKVIKLSKDTYQKMVQNLIWATGYNVLAIPLAAGVLYGFGILLSPAVGAALMTLSTVTVAFNAQLLRRVKL